MKINKKAEFDKMFVYILSIIVVVFAAFLVTKFAWNFTKITPEVENQKFYDEFEKNYESIYNTFSSLKNFEYSVNGKIEYVCFVSAPDCLDNLAELQTIEQNNPGTINSMKEIVNAKNGIILIDENGISDSKSTKTFIVDDNSGCYCVEPKTAGKFKLIMENIRNKVHIRFKQ